eukprot:TRINITY_DN6493_c0_g1_i1.p1 TRINITY_DN6493_c0_g1~~TRINITY_DN6493_c0_g1_i1.p1  ORF type:complete len:331 (+),score=68.86 TRINITY_DN6493_c0_g1_i1:92-1084(+)
MESSLPATLARTFTKTRRSRSWGFQALAVLLGVALVSFTCQFVNQDSAFLTPKTSARGNLQRSATDGNDQVSKGRVLVLGGNGYVGREVCKLAVKQGYQVVSLSRRGENPEPGNAELDQVEWVKGNAADAGTVEGLVGDADAVVHAIGLLFDVNSGMPNMNLIVSGSGSTPDESSTYDTVTRKTAFNVINAVKGKFRNPFSNSPTPVMFVSAAEAGWPDVSLGPEVENVAPSWLKEYLLAKRAVEKELRSDPSTIRPAMFRPSLIWSWTKFDVLPVIPVFNILNAVGVPFVDKTVTVHTLAKAIVAGLGDETVTGVQRFKEMEELEKRFA